MKHNLFEVSQYVIVFNNEDEVLLLKASKNTKIKDKWGFPGGHINHGETIEESLLREAKEEANLNIKILFPLKVHVIEKTYTIIFVAEYLHGKTKLSKEHINYRWVKIEDMKNLDLISDILIDYAKEAIKIRESFN